MDTSAIPVNLAALYDVLLACALLLGLFWGLPKIVQLLKRR
jgi:hypothetical protein